MTLPSQVPGSQSLSRTVPEMRARLIATLGAVVALAGLAGQFDINLARREGDVLAALWGMTRFFTNLTVAFAAGVLLWAALGGRVRARTGAGLVLSALVMALVYYLVLAPAWTPEGFRWWVAQAMHGATPLAVAVWWLACVPKAGLTMRMFPGWAAFPVGYLVMSLLRQAAGERAPYPFLNLGERGAFGVAVAALAITLVYLLLAAALIALARRLDQSESPGSSSSERP
ncbi:Pr6Pr family membrane protein [Frigidibacter sp. MR17.14]|uniref:Pr6Pr family membrane protein n=1 Tax=Frigidibacter sp. MR17.14 TaxID=3126509 RepID=UPI003012D67D